MENTQFFEVKKLEDNLLNEIKDESDDIGYYSLPYQDISSIVEFSKTITKNNIVVVGIGGSTLGTKAVYDFLKYSRTFEKKLLFCESTDPVLLNNTLIDLNLNDTVFLIISKSGSTIETISIFKYLLTKVNLDKENFIIVSDKNSSLHKLSQDKNLTYFEIPSNVGGRFSVLSTVGLVPLALIGVDIKALLSGAKGISEDFFSQKEMYSKLVDKAYFYAKNTFKYNINSLFSYSESLRSFNDWYVQLWGESLGKRQINSYLNVGLTPIGLIGPSDQHSFLQLIIEGKHDKSVSFIKLKEFDIELKIPNISIPNLEQLDYINGVCFSELINKQADSIILSLLKEEDIPLDIIQIDRIDEKSIGELFFYFQILTSLVAKILNVNAYNQPSVEDGKKILKEFFTSKANKI